MHGSRGELLRSLGLWTAIFAVIGSVVGSGVFKKAAPMAAAFPAPWFVLLAWALAGLVTLAGALTNVEVAGLIAEPGGQYAFFRRMYGNLFAYLYGWSSFAVIESATIAGVGYVFAECINELVRLPQPPPEWQAVSLFGLFFPFQNFGTKLATIIAIVVLTVANRRGIELGGLLSNILTVAKLFGITLVILFGLTLGGGQLGLLVDARAATPQSPGAFGFTGALFSAMLGAFWAFQGWNSITMLGGEVRDPKRNIPIAITRGVLAVICIYVLVNGVYFYIMPAGEIAALAQRENSIVAIEVVRRVAGEGGSRAVTLLILLSTFGTLHVTILTASRIYYAMGTEGVFFRGTGTAHPAYRTPSRALILQGIWSALLVLSGTFDQLTDRLVFASFIFYGMGALGVFVLRVKMKDHERPFLAWGYPWVPAAYVAFCAALLAVTVVRAPLDAGIGSGLVLAGLPLYWFWRKRYPGAPGSTQAP